MIRVLLADDHALLREGIKTLLSAGNEIEVVGEASNGQTAVTLAGQLKPDVIVMDVAMPVLNGIQATKQIKTKYPSIKILILSQFDSQEYLFTILHAGASGYVLKRSASTELVWAIKTAHEDQVYLSPEMTRMLVKDYLGTEKLEQKSKELLTAREQEILKMVAEGDTNPRIAEKLFISIKTVQTHRAHLMEKLGLHDRTELVKYAIAKGIITLENQSHV